MEGGLAKSHFFIDPQRNPNYKETRITKKIEMLSPNTYVK